MKDKIVYSSSGTITDLSEDLSRATSGNSPITFTAATDAIYIGSLIPFTSKYFKLSTLNVLGSNATVQYWDGTVWRNAASMQDNTKAFTQAGYIEFGTDRSHSWSAKDTEDITDLTSLKIYDMYWIKITYDADIAMTLDWMGDLFCSELQLQAVSPRVMNSLFMDDWQTGKVDWEEQRITATEWVIERLESINLNSSNLLLDKSQLSLATVYQTLTLIYSEMGDDDKMAKYDSRVKLLLDRSFMKDTNKDGSKQQSETGIKTKTMVR